MQKQQLIHLHRLGVALREFLDEHEDLPPEVTQDYDALNVDPTALNRPKDAHREAFSVLLADLTNAIDHASEATDDGPPVSGHPPRQRQHQ